MCLHGGADLSPPEYGFWPGVGSLPFEEDSGPVFLSLTKITYCCSLLDFFSI